MSNDFFDDILKDRSTAEAIISKLRKEATNEELALLKSVGKTPLRLLTYYPKQIDFLKETKQIKLATGGNSSGKTFIGAAEAMSRAEKVHPFDKKWNNKNIPRHGMVLIKDFEQFKQHGSAQSKILSMISEEKIANKGMKFHNGALTDVLYKDGSSFRVRSSRAGRASLQGGRLDWIWIDEDCITDRNMYDELIFRLSDSGEMPIIIYTYTPNLEEVEESFADSVLIPRCYEPDGTYDIALHQFSLFDNPHVPEATKLMLMRNTAGGQDQVNARFEGEVGRNSGLIYKFDKKHIIQPIPREHIKANAKAIFRIIDPHPVKPIAVSFIACMEDGNIIQFEELFQPGLVRDVAKRIRAICDGMGHLIRKTIIDYAGNTTNKISGQSMRDEFQAHGIGCENCVKDVTLGINYVRELLYYTDEMPPKLQVTSNCTNTIREAGKYRQDPKTGIPIKKHDEFMDNWRYFVCDPDAQFYFLKRERKHEISRYRVIDERSNVETKGRDLERVKRIKARQARVTALTGKGIGRKG